MFGWLSRRFGKSQKKTVQLPPREFSDGSVEQESAPQQVSSGSLYSVLKTAIADEEQIADSIKMRAQKEAKAEAARIIDKAQLEAQEIKGRAEIDAQKRADDIISAANRKAEITEVEVKHKALQFLISVGEEVEKEVREEYEKAYSRLSSSLQDLMNEGQDIETELKGKIAKLWESKSFELKEYEAMLLSTSEAGVPPIETSAPVETELKPDIASKEKVEEPAQVQEEAIVEKVEEPALLKLDGQAIYTGEVELLIASMVELKLVSQLYNYLQTVPELKILYTRGSWNQGTTITVVPDKPMPLIDIISKTPGVEVTAELLEEDGLPVGRASSLLRSEKRETKRIKLTLKEAQPR